MFDKPIYTSKQQVFDIVVKKMSKQGWKQTKNSNGACVYRSDSGHCCALGALIPSELYNEEMEGFMAPTMFNHFPRVAKLFADHVDWDWFIHDLQTLHDANDNPEMMRNAFHTFAIRRGLNLPPELCAS